jgi:alkylhydroperoxidase family enzyme
MSNCEEFLGRPPQWFTVTFGGRAVLKEIEAEGPLRDRKNGVFTRCGAHSLGSGVEDGSRGVHRASRPGKTPTMAKQRISYVPLDKMDARMRAEMERCRREGTPRPESSAIRAHVPACFWFFAESWNNIYRNGILDHAIKELCRLYVSRSVACEYCGNQRSVKATTSRALIEDQVLDLLNFEKSTKYDERQKAALAYAEAIVWHLNTDDSFWERMHRHFSEPELVELGCMIGLTLGQQSWLRLLNIEHHQVLSGTTASMAPGYEDEARLRASKAQPDYWAKKAPSESAA